MAPRHSSVNESTDASATDELLRRYRQSAQKRLDSTGTIETGAGFFEVNGSQISFAADPGCETFNDDFVSVWRPKQTGAIHWAAAIADGVTGSLLAKEAAELACLWGLAAIAKGNGGIRSSSRNPIAVVARLFHQIGRQVLLQPEKFIPAGCPKSVWEIATREGKFLQTTLNLIWSTEDGIRVMAVGDGGLLYSLVDAPAKVASHQFGSGKLQCIGPRSATADSEAYLLANWKCFACHTDGMADSVQELSDLPERLFDSEYTAASVKRQFSIC